MMTMRTWHAGVLTVLLAALPAPIANAQTHEGSLESDDPRLPDSGKYMDSYTFEVEEGQRIVVTMTSDALDTYLILESPDGETTENDDASPGTSLVELVAPTGGTWTATATSYADGETGDYELTIELGGIAQVEVIEGRLDARDTMSIKGEYYDTHHISVEAGVEFYVELVSLGFDGYLSLTTPSGRSHRNDDAGSIELSRIGPLTGEDGEFVVYATSVGAEAVGAYDLRILRFE